jgi:hypothetical protein
MALRVRTCLADNGVRHDLDPDGVERIENEKMVTNKEDTHDKARTAPAMT